jgi:Flp pilus assembly pilin Flp
MKRKEHALVVEVILLAGLIAVLLDLGVAPALSGHIRGKNSGSWKTARGGCR